MISNSKSKLELSKKQERANAEAKRALAALKRARIRAEEVAAMTGTELIFVIDGKICSEEAEAQATLFSSRRATNPAWRFVIRFPN